MISYSLAPIPIWPLRDLIGFPLAGGKMYTYRDTVRSDFKPVYQDPAGTLPYIQPIIFNAAGFNGPFYWASDENYYIEIYDVNDSLVQTIPHYNAPGGVGPPVPITTYIDLKNHITDPTFRFPLMGLFDPAPLSAIIGTTNWYFTKNNMSATDFLQFVTPTPGSVSPPNNPYRYLRYQCAIAGGSETEKFLFWKFDSVVTFQGTEVTIAFWARCPLGNPNLEVKFRQLFGTGGSPAVETAVTSFVLTPDWAQYSITTVVPSISGKTVGSGNDDFLAVLFEYPKNSVTTIDLTLFQYNIGNQLLPFEYNTADYLDPFNRDFYPYFEFASDRIEVSTVADLIPIDFVFSDTNTDWIVPPNKIVARQRCRLQIYLTGLLEGANSGDQIQIYCLKNSSALVVQYSNNVITANGSQQFAISAQVRMNGYDDYIQFFGRSTAPNSHITIEHATATALVL